MGGGCSLPCSLRMGGGGGGDAGVGGLLMLKLVKGCWPKCDRFGHVIVTGPLCHGLADDRPG